MPALREFAMRIQVLRESSAAKAGCGATFDRS
jgi:hypothetical protein